ncbi:MAG: DUF1801 domain-containing protein [Actinomycetes bacterium]
MSDVDNYLSALPDQQRAALQHLRETIVSIIPDAEEVMSYGMPGYRIDGEVVAGFAAFRHHLSYFPHSGSVLAQCSDDVADYEQTKSSLHFSAAQPLPKALVRKLIRARRAQQPRRGATRGSGGPRTPR